MHALLVQTYQSVWLQMVHRPIIINVNVAILIVLQQLVCFATWMITDFVTQNLCLS